jgi:hypothetical protein
MIRIRYHVQQLEEFNVSAKLKRSLHSSPHDEDLAWADQQWSLYIIQFVSRPRLGNLSIIPPKKPNQLSSLPDSLIRLNCRARPEIVECNAVLFEQHPGSRAIKRSAHQVTFSFPDKPPISLGYNIPLHFNTLLSWQIERGFTSHWGGRNNWLPREVLRKPNIGDIGAMY